MKEHITVEELEKASRNVQRLSEFIGERRAWMLASDAGDAASKVTDAAQSLAAVIADLTGGDPAEEIKVEHPPKLEPSARVNAHRLVKFADFMNQLKMWFAAHDGTGLVDGSEESIRVLRVSLTSTIESVNQLRGPATTTEPTSEPTSEPLVSNDLGPVAEVDMTARLTLEDTFQRPLLQVYQGVTELTPTATSRVDEFFAKQDVKLEDTERRRFHDKVLRWIQSTPDGQTLVIRLSGLSGKVEAYSSYQPKN